MSIRNFVFVNFLVFGLMSLRVQALNELPTDILQKEIFAWLAKSFSSRQKATWDEARKQLKKIGLVCTRFCLLTKDEREILCVLVPKAHYYAAIGDMDEIFACKFAYEPMNCRDCFHMTPSMYATTYGQSHIERLFEVVGYSDRSTHFAAPLVTAEQFIEGVNDNDVTLIELLVLASPEIMLQQPIKKASEEIFQKDASMRSQAEKTALFIRQCILEICLLNGQIDVLPEMKLCGANVNVRSQNGWTPLLLAAENWRWNQCDQLLQHGADVNVESDNGATALIIATSMYKVEYLKKFVQAGADINRRNRQGQTPLLICAAGSTTNIFKSPEIAQVLRALLDNGADVTSRDPKYDMTALQWVIERLLIEHIPPLIEAGIRQQVLPKGLNCIIL